MIDASVFFLLRVCIVPKIYRFMNRYFYIVIILVIIVHHVTVFFVLPYDRVPFSLLFLRASPLLISFDIGFILMNQAPPSTWNPHDWSYLAEGGKHAIFRYSPQVLQNNVDDGDGSASNDSTDDFTGHVLRIPKHDLAYASYLYEIVAFPHEKGRETIFNNTSLTSQPLVESDESNTQIFQRQIVRPLLGHCYLDLSRTLLLPMSFCARIYSLTLSSDLIPPSRISSWKFDKKDAIFIELQTVVKASLLRDHTCLAPHPRLSSNSAREPMVLSVEIKPKAGFIATSPLIPPENRCKYYRTRYSLQQELMQKGRVRKGWRTNSGGSKSQQTDGHVPASSLGIHCAATPLAFTPSNYSPLDLFSGNRTQIHTALKELSKNMQNNFRIWYNRRQLFGECETPSDNYCKEILETLLAGLGYNNDHQVLDTDARSSLLDIITTTLSTVLDREQLLSNLLSIQSFDVIDGDGAVKVYERLVYLCDGSHSDAELLLDEASLIIDSLPKCGNCSTDNFNDRSLLALSPYTIPQCSQLIKLLDDSEQFRTYLRGQQEKGLCGDENVVNAYHIKCMECVTHLSKQACVYLLQNWLLSLALCDISFFVTFRLLTKKKTSDLSLDSEPIHENEECQASGCGGTVTCVLNSNMLTPTPTVVFCKYQIKVVDCDPKPAKKLRKRAEVENIFKYVSK